MNFDNQRILMGCLYVAGALAGYIVGQFAESIVDLAAPQLALAGGFSVVTALQLLSLAGGLGGAEYARRHPVANAFLLDVIVELKKVTWPAWKDVRGATLVILVMSLAVAVMIWIFDKGFGAGLSLIF